MQTYLVLLARAFFLGVRTVPANEECFHVCHRNCGERGAQINIPLSCRPGYTVALLIGGLITHGFHSRQVMSPRLKGLKNLPGGTRSTFWLHLVA